MRTVNAAILVMAAVMLAAWGAMAIADRERPVALSNFERASRAAVAAVGSGTTMAVDPDIEGGATWEVEVVRADGKHVDVLLDARFRVLSVGPERDANETANAPAPAAPYVDPAPAAPYVDPAPAAPYVDPAPAPPYVDPAPAAPYVDERPTARYGANRAAAAALDAVGGGTVDDVDRENEGGATWEVEITKPDGRRVEVLLDAQFRVLGVDAEEDHGEDSDDWD